MIMEMEMMVEAMIMIMEMEMMVEAMINDNDDGNGP